MMQKNVIFKIFSTHKYINYFLIHKNIFTIEIDIFLPFITSIEPGDHKYFVKKLTIKKWWENEFPVNRKKKL